MFLDALADAAQGEARSVVLPAVGHLLRGLVPQRAVRPVGVIFHPPLFDEHFGFQQRAEDFAVEAFIPELVVEAFDVAVFPRGTGPDIERFNFVFFEPVADGVGDELRAIVAADVLGLAVPRHGRLDHGDDLHRPDRPGHVHRQALTRVLIDQGQHSQLAPPLGLVLHESPSSRLGWAGALAGAPPCSGPVAASSSGAC